MADAFDFAETSLLPQAYQFRHYMEHYGATKAQAKQLVRRAKQERIFISDSYQANLTPLLAPEPFGSGTWISLKRVDKEPLRTRAELGSAMRALLPGFHGFELFPAPRRLVDSSNQYHLWCFRKRSALERAQLGEPLKTPAGVVEYPLLNLPAEYGNSLCALDTRALPPEDQEDWRKLQAYKEHVHPDCEAAMLSLPDPQHPLNQALLVIRDPRGMWPFGFRDALHMTPEDAARVGAKQRGVEQLVTPFSAS